MRQINLLLLCGGGSSEHNISLLSAGYIEKTLLERSNYNLLWLELTAEGQYKTKQGEICQLTNNRQVVFESSHKAPWNIDYVIPCIHGFPGETGDIQSYFELIKLPYLGCGPEASINCFNKVTAKMWFSALGIPNTPYIFLDSLNDEAIEQTRNALNNWGSVFVKACSQGSSIGCYRLDNADDIASTLQKAFEFSPYLVIEKTIQARELEVAVFEHQGEVIATLPGEIVCAKNTFYSFDEKYDTSSQAVTHIVAKNLDDAISAQIRQYAIKAFKGMKLKNLSRIDFFLTDNNEILLNEINTFPGLTPISMFPKMLINHGVDFGDWLSTSIEKQLG